MSGSFNIFGWLQGDKAEDPEWLTPMEGVFQLLSRPELDFIARVCSSIKERTKLVTETSESRAQEIRVIADDLRNKFVLVVEKLQKNSSSRQRYQEIYPQWRRFRNSNVFNLREIADLIDGHRKNCIAPKVIGSLASLLGGGLCLAAGPIGTVVGSAMVGVGTLTSAGTSVVEEVLVWENQSKAKKIMKLDQDHMMELCELLDEANCLHEAVDHIQSISRKTNFLAVAKSLQDAYKEDSSRGRAEEEIQGKLKSLGCPPGLREEMSNVIGILLAFLMLLNRYRPVINLVLKSHNVVTKVRLSADLFRAAYNGLNSAATFKERGQLTKSQKGIIAGGMILDVVNIFVVLSQDPNSVEGREVRRVANQLENEANYLKSLYEENKTLDESVFKKRESLKNEIHQDHQDFSIQDCFVMLILIVLFSVLLRMIFRI